MSLLPAVPHLAEGEALTGYLGRLARENGHRMTPFLQQVNAQELIARRVLSSHSLAMIEAATGIPSAALAAATLARYPSGVIGTPEPRYVSGDPLGWASPAFSSYCPDCVAEGQPWKLQHQTALALTCSLHGAFLRAACGRCAGRATMFDKSKLSCRHRNDIPPDLVQLPPTAESALLHFLEQASSDDVAVQGLRGVRALAALSWIDVQRPSNPPDESRVLRDLLTTYGEGAGSGGKYAARRLQRPPGEPWINACLIGVFWSRVDPSNLAIDEDWLADRIDSTTADPIAAKRAEPFLQELGFDIGRSTPTIHETWNVLAQRHVGEYPALSGRDMPSALWSPAESMFGDWAEPVARAALVHHVMTGCAYTTSVTLLGHDQRAVTRTRGVLTTAPTPQQVHDFGAACATLEPQTRSHGYEGRAQQQQVTYVPPTITRRLLCHLPQHPQLSPGQVAAAWLWVRTTSAPLATVPFIDGRRLRYLKPALADWTDTAPADDQLALLDWNATQLTQLGRQRKPSDAPPIAAAI